MQIRGISKFILAALVFASVSACIEEADNSASSQSMRYFRDQLEGSWAAPCEDLSANGDANIKGQKRVYSFSGSSVVFTYRYFEEPICTTLVAKYYATYTAVFSDALQPQGHKIDLTLVDDSVITLNAPVTADYNARGVCGLFAGWFAFNSRSITGLGCDTLLGNFVPNKNAGSQVFSIIAVATATTPAKLFVGDTSVLNGLSPDTRPIQFDQRVYSKE